MDSDHSTTTDMTVLMGPYDDPEGDASYGKFAEFFLDLIENDKNEYGDFHGNLDEYDSGSADRD